MNHLGREEKRFNYIYLPTKRFDTTKVIHRTGISKSSLTHPSTGANQKLQGVYGCRQADDFGGGNDAKHHEG